MNTKSTVQLLALSFIWSAFFTCVQYVNRALGVYVSAALMRVSALAFVLLSHILRRRLADLKAPAGSHLSLILIGVMNFILDGLAYIGFQYCPVSMGTALLKCDIIFVNLVTAIFYKKKISLRDWLLTLFMLTGVFILIDVDFQSAKLNNAYCLLFVLSAFVVCCNAFLIQSVQRRFADIKDMCIASYNLTFSGVCFALIAVIQAVFFAEPLRPITGNVPFVIILGGFVSMALFEVYYKSLREFSVWLVKIFLLTMPVICALMSYVLYGETLSPKQLWGIFIICIGAFFIILNEKQKAASA